MKKLSDGRYLVKPDKRHRVSLGQMATFNRYWIEVKPGGTIVLTPAPVAEPRRDGG
jgi:hypothetical protein